MRILSLVALVLLTFTLTIPDADARRFGGGKSFGKQRQSLNLNRQQQQAAPKQPQQSGQQQAAPGSAASGGAGKWLGPLAGLAAGGLLASLLMGDAFDGINMMDILILIGLAAAIFFIIRALRKGSGKPVSRSMQYSSAGASGSMPSYQPSTAAPVGSAGDDYDSSQSAQTATASAGPADFDEASFLEQARRSFVSLQAANDARDLEDIRAYTTPELFAALSQQMSEHGEASQQTDVLFVNAALLDVTTENNLAIASVRFTGELREAPDAQIEAFDEIWHVEKDLADSRSAWLIAGIQQTADMKH